MNEPTAEQQQLIARISDLLYSNFGCIHVDTQVRMITYEGETIATFNDWQALANHLRVEFSNWYSQIGRELFAISHPAMQNTALDRHYAARAEELFGNHSLMTNQDDPTDTDAY